MGDSEWREVKLGDVARYSNLRINTEKLTSENYISTENMLPEKAGIRNASSIPSGSAIKYKSGQTLISNIRPYFKKIWYATMAGGCSADVLVFETSDEVDDKYFFYYLNQDDFFDYVMAGSKGTKMPRGDKQQILMYPFKYPNKSEQKAIVATLSCLDDKIELNNKINKKLEEIAQAIFKSWCVDFEPFQDGEFEDSELGRIPKGWRVGTLGDIADITMGQSPKGSSYNENEDGVVFYQGRTDFGKRFPTIRLYTTEPKRMANKGDILLSVRAPVGDINVAFEDCCIGRGLASLTSKNKCNFYLLYQLKNLKDSFNIYNSEGTVFGSINKNTLNNIQIIIPPNSIIQEYQSSYRNLDNMIEENYVQITALTSIRDTLLPKLMSGEVRVTIEEVQ